MGRGKGAEYWHSYELDGEHLAPPQPGDARVKATAPVGSEQPQRLLQMQWLTDYPVASALFQVGRGDCAVTAVATLQMTMTCLQPPPPCLGALVVFCSLRSHPILSSEPLTPKAQPVTEDPLRQRSGPSFLRDVS